MESAGLLEYDFCCRGAKGYLSAGSDRGGSSRILGAWWNFQASLHRMGWRFDVKGISIRCNPNALWYSVDGFSRPSGMEWDLFRLNSEHFSISCSKTHDDIRRVSLSCRGKSPWKLWNPVIPWWSAFRQTRPVLARCHVSSWGLAVKAYSPICWRRLNSRLSARESLSERPLCCATIYQKAAKTYRGIKHVN